MFGKISISRENMSLLDALLNQENIRNRKMIEEYEKELATLPKGSIKIKTIGHNSYYYLVYRDGKKIISKYIGKDAAGLAAIKEQLDKRHHIELMLKHLKQEQQQIKKMEAML